MEWKSFGFREFPFEPKPITLDTLDLFSGNEQKQLECRSVLKSPNKIIVIEGGHGVGTTSFGNFLRFQLLKEKKYFTPISEIRIESKWTLETVLSVIMANLIRDIGIQFPSLISNERFIEAKSVSRQIHEAYRNFGVTAFGIGGNYGKTSQFTQPLIVPSQVLSHHLKYLNELLIEQGYPNGILVQLNNLDVGTIHEESDLKGLFNSLRDYLHTIGLSWLLVGDLNLRSFISKHVDRVEDVISYEVTIDPLNEEEFVDLVQKRILFCKEITQAIFPVDMEVLTYLFHITRGRLRYLFGLLSSMMTKLHVGDLTDHVMLDLAKPVIRELSLERLKRHALSPSESVVLECIAKAPAITTTELADLLKKNSSFISNVLAKLLEAQVVSVIKEGKKRKYYPSIEAEIVYG